MIAVSAEEYDPADPDEQGIPWDDPRVVDLWTRSVTAVSTGDLSLVEREIDWVIKWKLIERYRSYYYAEMARQRVPLTSVPVSLSTLRPNRDRLAAMRASSRRSTERSLLGPTSAPGSVPP